MAEAWRLARGEQVREEAVLELGLAATLECLGAWPRLVEALGWAGLPSTPPAVSVQDVVEGGRTDITLAWPSAPKLVLELKVWEPPTSEQIDCYLRAGLDVAAVAAHHGVIEVTPPPGRRFWGVATWRQIHASISSWDRAPLEARQFVVLLERLGVVTPRLMLPALQGVVASWDAWATLEDWVHRATNDVGAVLTKAGFPCVRKDGARDWVRIDERREHRRFVGWTWPSPWRDDEQFGVCVGLRMGTPSLPTLDEGVPDVMVCLHVDPRSAVGRGLREDAPLGAAALRWRGRAPLVQLVREWEPLSTVWSVLRARASAAELLEAEDQGAHLAAWARDRAQEWVEDGVVDRVVAVWKAANVPAK